MALILLAEDVPEQADKYANILAMAGENEVVTAENGVEALEFLAESAVLPDLIVTDYEMPEMDGIKFLKAMKGDERWREIPVIVHSAALRIGVEAREAGAYWFIHKPQRGEVELAYIAAEALELKNTPAG